MRKLIVCICGLLLLSTGAIAQIPASINCQEPASLLVYPYYDSNPGSDTLITVTNINISPEFNMTTWHLFGEVYVHFYYVDGSDTDVSCPISNRTEYLSPGDTLSVLARDHNPAAAEGFLYIIAENPNTLKPWDFDGRFTTDPGGNDYDSGLIGDAYVFNGLVDYLWSFPAYGIRSAVGWGKKMDDDNDGDVEFNDTELMKLPRTMYCSSFVEVDHLGSDSEVILLTFFDQDVRVDVDFLFYNNIEVEMSQEWDFRCWAKESLVDIFGRANNLGGELDPDDPLLPIRIPTGWFSVQVDKGRDTAVGEDIPWCKVPLFGAIIQSVLDTQDYSCARLLHHSSNACVKGDVEYF
jgi:hypothetical protein